MKKIFAYLAFAAAMTFAASCSREATFPDTQEQGGIALSLALEGTGTKTDGEGLENSVTSVEYFFYSDITKAPVYHIYDTEPTLSNLEYKVAFTVGDGDLAAYTLNDFFPNGGNCEFFAVFNYPEEIGAVALADVKQKAVANTFAYNVPDSQGDPHWYVTKDEDVDLGYEKYFVMTGQKTLSPAVAGVKETIDMKRIAAKVSFVINVAQSKTVTDGDATEVWTPMLNDNNPRVYLSNAVANSLIGSADATDPVFPETLTQFDYNPDIINFGTEYSTTSPFYYTFPLAWEGGDDSEIYCKLIIPWKMERTEGGIVTYSTQRELYYKVVFPDQEILANNWYVFTINADFLGNEGEEPTITIKADNAQVYPWTVANDVNPVISAAKYLSVEKGVDKPEITYTTGTTITYAASDQVTIVIKNISQQNLTTGNDEYLIQNGNIVNATLTARNNRNANPRKASEVNWTSGYVNGWIIQDSPNSLFELKHLLNSDLTSKNMDVTPYTYEIELHLGPEGSETYGDPKFTKTVKIVQYPEVYVVEDPNRSGTSNNGYAFLNTYTTGDEITSRSGGYNYTTYLHTTNNNYTDYEYIGGIHGLTGQNTNASMYVLTIAVSDTYVIGDPRSTTVSNPSFTYRGRRTGGNQTFNGSWLSAPWTQGGNHALTFYYPTSGENTKTMIAPKIRVASSYGVCRQGISQDNAIARCAAYQEDGIPAGRWRLPTLAEVQFISTLSSLGRIPYLFGLNSSTQSSSSYYWTANGLIHINNGVNPPVAEEYTGSSTNLSPSVRCVYDEWYWGDASPNRPVNASTFTWGDRQR